MDNLQIKYPIYIVSKGRYNNCITAKKFISDGINFKIAVEPQEYKNYCENIPSKYIYKLPFSNLGLGSYPARNACWDDSIKNGYNKHFLFDDNIYGFYRVNNGIKENCSSKLAIVTLQELTNKFTNVPLSGFNYGMFITKAISKPYFFNVHVYSGMLIDNSMPWRWRMKYNEDVDLSLQVLHNKKCTILLNAFVIKKVSTTAKMKGGNQTELYKNNDIGKKILKTKSLQLVWPQYVKIIYKYGRPHHQVSWNKFFKHPLKLNKCGVLPQKEHQPHETF